MQDPTYDEMLEVLLTFDQNEFGDFDREEAIYWFAHDWHGGQSTNLYSVLSTSDFNPGPIANKPSESAAILYEELEAAFA